MRVSVETTGGLKRKATIAVPSAEFEANVAVRLKAAAGDLKLPGFRPGKVPMKEVRRRLGPSARNQAASDMAIASFSEAMRGQPFTLATQAQIEIVNLSPGADLEFTATFEVLPEVQLAPLDSLEVRRPRATIEEADIDFTIEEIRRQRREWIPAERPAQEGDRVVVDVVWKRGEDVLREREGLMFVLEEQMNSLPRWKDALIGLAANATGRIATPVAALASEAEETEEGAAATDAALPLDEPGPATVVAGLEAEPDTDEATSQPDPGALLNENENAAQGVESNVDGHAADAESPPPEHAVEEPPATRAEAASESDLVAEFTVQSVEAPQMPAIDDALFDWFEVDAEGDRLAKFRAEVRERMVVELQASTRRATTQEVLAVLVEAHDFELPPTMAQAEAAAELQRLAAVFENIPVDVAERTAQVAKRRLRARLVVREIVSRHSLTPDDQRIARRVDEIASAYEQAAEVRRALYRDENKMREIATAVLEEQAVEHVLAQARVADVDMPYRDLVANQELPERPAAAPPAARGGENQDGAPTSEATVAPAADASAEKPGLLGKVKRLFAKQA